jgi:hypothetical protein
MQDHRQAGVARQLQLRAVEVRWRARSSPGTKWSSPISPTATRRGSSRQCVPAPGAGGPGRSWRGRRTAGGCPAHRPAPCAWASARTRRSAPPRRPAAPAAHTGGTRAPRPRRHGRRRIPARPGGSACRSTWRDDAAALRRRRAAGAGNVVPSFCHPAALIWSPDDEQGPAVQPLPAPHGRSGSARRNCGPAARPACARAARRAWPRPAAGRWHAGARRALAAPWWPWLPCCWCWPAARASA